MAPVHKGAFKPPTNRAGSGYPVAVKMGLYLILLVLDVGLGYKGGMTASEAVFSKICSERIYDKREEKTEE